MRRYLIFSAILPALLLSLTVNAQDFPDPEKLGPHPVGVTTVQYKDWGRIDETTGKPRSLLTEIWYPATEESRELPKNKYSDFNMGGTNETMNLAMKFAFQVDVASLDATFQNLAVRDARVRPGIFPLVLFSHGNGGMRHQNVFWCEHLASHGYIVVAPDHTENCFATTVDGEVVTMKSDNRDQAAADRPKDISFLIDTMTLVNNGADSRFLNHIDLNNIGLAGHSFGGYTAAWTIEHDDRIDAIVPMAGTGKKDRSRFDCPVMVMVATEDDTIGLEGNEAVRAYYEESKGPRYLVEFKDGGHYSFTEMFQFLPTFGDGVGEGTRTTNGEALKYAPKELVYRYTKGYSTAFLGKFLKGQQAYDAYLQENHDPEALIVKWGQD